MYWATRESRIALQQAAAICNCALRKKRRPSAVGDRNENATFHQRPNPVRMKPFHLRISVRRPDHRRLLRRPPAPLFKNHEHCADHHGEAHEVVPLELLFEIEDRKEGENGERDHFLDGFELRGGELVRADAVRRYLEAIFGEGNEPADDNHLGQRDLAVLQMSVPGEGHEDVGYRQQNDRRHGRLCCLKRRRIEKWLANDERFTIARLCRPRRDERKEREKCEKWFLPTRHRRQSGRIRRRFAPAAWCSAPARWRSIR